MIHQSFWYIEVPIYLSEHSSINPNLTLKTFYRLRNTILLKGGNGGLRLFNTKEAAEAEGQRRNESYKAIFSPMDFEYTFNCFSNEELEAYSQTRLRKSQAWEIAEQRCRWKFPIYIHQTEEVVAPSTLTLNTVEETTIVNQRKIVL